MKIKLNWAIQRMQPCWVMEVIEKTTLFSSEKVV